MRKIMFILILISSLWSEEIKIDDIYEVYISKTVDIELDGIEKEEIFFGKYEDWNKNQVEKLKEMNKVLSSGAAGLGSASTGVANSVANSTGKALGQGLGMGLGIGLVFGLGELGYNKLTEDKLFILVMDYKNKKNEKTRVFGLIILNNFSDEVIIKQFLLQEILKKGL